MIRKQSENIDDDFQAEFKKYTLERRQAVQHGRSKMSESSIMSIKISRFM
jgi:hypothetical protein